MRGICEKCANFGRFYCKFPTRNFDSKGRCHSFERKPMSDKIEINVTVNDQPGTLADVSEETLSYLRALTRPTKPVKPIEHGDYGIHLNEKYNPRLFIKNASTGKIDGYDKFFDGCAIRDVNRDSQRRHYTITGNIFKEMREKRNGS